MNNAIQEIRRWNDEGTPGRHHPRTLVLVMSNVQDNEIRKGGHDVGEGVMGRTSDEGREGKRNDESRA